MEEYLLIAAGLGVALLVAVPLACYRKAKRCDRDAAMWCFVGILWAHLWGGLAGVALWVFGVPAWALLREGEPLGLAFAGGLALVLAGEFLPVAFISQKRQSFRTRRGRRRSISRRE